MDQFSQNGKLARETSCVMVPRECRRTMHVPRAKSLAVRAYTHCMDMQAGMVQMQALDNTLHEAATLSCSSGAHDTRRRKPAERIS